MKRIFTLFLIILAASAIYGQTLPKKAHFLPDAYLNPTSSEYLSPLITNNLLDDMHWFVFSDRAKNLSYTDPQKSEVYKTINYMERFFVAETEGDMIHLYADNVQNWPVIGPDAKDYGWIHKDNLILSTHCMMNESNFEKKAMILTRLADVEEMVSGGVEQTRFYSDPGLTKWTGKESRQFDIYFVYKISKDASSVLLGKEVSIGIGTTEELQAQMLGWVEISKVTFWDQRICIEPNWDKRAVEERKAKGIPPIIFLEESSCLTLKESGTYSQNYVAKDDDPGTERYVGAFKRYPVIYKKKNGVMKTGVMGKVYSEGKEVDITDEKLAEVKQEFELIKQQAKNLNVVFVVDGTNSMGPYFNPISTAIKKSFESLKGSYTSSNIRFAGVIYRDYADGDHLVDIHPLSSDITSITTFFDTARTDYKGDKDIPEAMFYGMKEALTSLNLQPDQSNFIILVGDVGSHNRKDPSYISQEEVINLLSGLEASMISFQVNNGQDRSYDMFMRQSREMILQTTNNIKSNEGSKKVAWRPDMLIDEDPYFRSDGNKYFLYNQPIYGYIMFADKGQTLPSDQLLLEIHKMIGEYDKTITKWLLKSEQVIDEGASISDVVQDEFSYSEGVINFLSKIKGLSPGQIKTLVKGTSQYSITGFAINNAKGLKESLFKEILFMSNLELGSTIDKLDRLCNFSYATPNDLRERLYETWIEILKNHLGDFEEEEYMQKSMAELQNIIFGVPSTSALLSSIKLSDIKDEKAMEFDKIMYYQGLLKKTFNELQQIQIKSDYEYSFLSNDNRYYWISIDVFP
jgi:hypothetical protein